MAATSVTGVSGPGDSGKFTTVQLAILAEGPSILLTAIATSIHLGGSPPLNGNTVTFPKPLPGVPDDYVIMLTTRNGGAAYVADISEADGNVTGFTFITETECDIMYLVAKTGIEASV